MKHYSSQLRYINSLSTHKLNDDKENVLLCVYCMCNKISFSHKKNEVYGFLTTPINMEKIMLSKIRHHTKGKYCMTFLMHTI